MAKLTKNAGVEITAEKADELVVKFERCASRLQANVGSVVKRKAAERDLLKCAGAVRDFLDAATGGEKHRLEDIFGGGCRHLHRIKHVMEAAECTDEGKADTRWSELAKTVATTEEVLSQLGIFKPWVPTTAPTKITYSDVPNFIIPGAEVDFAPAIEGCNADTLAFSIVPALPQFLTLDTKTGHIRGSPCPSLDEPEKAYTITGFNTAGSCTAKLEFGIRVAKPESISFEEMQIAVGSDVKWAPKVEGGRPREWSISPELPRGLALDAKTGTIMGVPVQTAALGTYKITGENKAGSCECTLEFKVDQSIILGLDYPDATNVDLAMGCAVFFNPEVRFQGPGGSVRKRSMSIRSSLRNVGVDAANGMYTGRKWKRARSALWKNVMLRGLFPTMTFEVTPELPAGLVMSKVTGVISGSTREECKRQVYKVVCKNESSEGATHLNFGIVLGPPRMLRYLDVPDTLFDGVPVTFLPEVEGWVEKWSVEPALPSGITLDEGVGIIGGIPAGKAPSGEWTITASNEKGQAQAVVKFAVQRCAPQYLSYSPISMEHALDWPMKAMNPRVEDSAARPVEVDLFTVEPPLPAGMTLDPATGQISGQPTAVADLTTYTITAANESGSCQLPLPLEVKLMAPEQLMYEHIDDAYILGDSISLSPSLKGSATAWECEPALPKGLTLDLGLGTISGLIEEVAPLVEYAVTASNDAGGTSCVISFEVVAPPPTSLQYPEMGEEFYVDTYAEVEAVVNPSPAGCVFTIDPVLPEGLELNATTGEIKGEPKGASDHTDYVVTATNKTGTVSCSFAFEVVEPMETLFIEHAVTGSVEEVMDVKQMPKEPQKPSLEWMIWMVHRVWLNDPTLEILDFTLMPMPLPHVEPRVAPKLMQGLAGNTHIRTLLLSSSNVRAPQGPQLAEALQTNSTLEVLNIESNYVDVYGLLEIARAQKENPNCKIHTWRFSNQHARGDNFGRQVEQAVAELVEKNTQLLKVGFTPHDHHWRQMVSKWTMRNQDLDRRRRKEAAHGPEVVEEEVKTEQTTLTKVTVKEAPETPIWEIFDDDDAKLRLVRGWAGEKKSLPLRDHLLAFAKAKGESVPYAKVAVLLKDFRAKFFEAAAGMEVSCVDEQRKTYQGRLQSYEEKNDRVTIKVAVSEVVWELKSAKLPAYELSDQVAEWLSVA